MSFKIDNTRHMISFRAWFRQFVMFFGVGAVATALHYVVMLLLVTGLDVYPVVAAFLGSLAGAVLSYFLNYRYTFNSKESHSSTLVKFGIVAGTGMLLNLGLVALFVEVMGIHYFIAQMVSTAIILCWNFAINKLWTFKES